MSDPHLGVDNSEICPDERVLAALLTLDSVDPHLEQHIETCPNCQARLTQLCEPKVASKWNSLLADGLAPETASPPEAHRDTRGDTSNTRNFDRNGRLPTVDGFDIHHEIGRGGMGVVFEATEKELGRRVAIKILLTGALAGPERIHRFLGEAQAVAKLKHPCIVAVHRVGEFEGLPFLSLELIDGPNLAEFMRGQQQESQAIARLMILLAEAVDVAHRQRVIHRDIKPANILLDLSKGVSLLEAVPKLTDFGLARHLDAEDLTRTQQAVGTPSYMAPERLTGDPGTLSYSVDTYGLGCVLYELLTGRPPYRGLSIAEILDQSAKGGPEHPRSINAFIDRDLETICLKCLAHEPSRRYSTALQLSDDLRRWQKGLPILARRSSVAYRMLKWVRRQPVLSAAVLLVFLSLSASLAIWVNSTRDIARNLARTREALNQYITSVRDDGRLQVADLAPLRAELLEEALLLYDDILSDTKDVQILADKADVHAELGHLRKKLGAPEVAQRHFEQSINLIQGILSEQLNQKQQEHYLRQLASTQINLSVLFSELKQYEASLAIAREASKSYDSLTQNDPNDTQLCFFKSILHRNISGCLQKLGRTEEAIDEIHRAISINEGLPCVFDYRFSLCTSLRRLVGLLHDADRMDDVIPVLDRGEGILQTLLWESRLPRYRAEHVEYLAQYADFYARKKQISTAIEYLERAAQQQCALAAMQQSEVRYANRLTSLYTELAKMHDLIGHDDIAEEYHRDIENMRQAGGAPRSPNQELISAAESGLQQIYLDISNFELAKAKDQLQSILATLDGLEPHTESGGQETQLLAIAHERMARVRFYKGEFREALEHWLALEKTQPLDSLPQLIQARRLWPMAKLGMTGEVLQLASRLVDAVEDEDERLALSIGRAVASLSAPMTSVGGVLEEQGYSRAALSTQAEEIFRKTEQRIAYSSNAIQRSVVLDFAEYDCALALWYANVESEKGRAGAYYHSERALLGRAVSRFHTLEETNHRRAVWNRIQVNQELSAIAKLPALQNLLAENK
ncbi:MAG: serine/threonine-protein kinase [Planctomycetota bacterium]